MGSFPQVPASRQSPVPPSLAPSTTLANIALLAIGANMISDINSSEKNAKIIRILYPHILQLLLQLKDWRFAKLRATLTLHTVTPAYGYKFAYQLPADFARLCMSHYPQMRGLNPIAYPPGYWYQVIDTTGYPRYYNYDPSVYPGGAPFVFEVIPGVVGPPAVGDTFCLLTDYDNTSQAIIIDYIRYTDETWFTPAFKQCLIDRLSMEMAIPIAESAQKKKDKQGDFERGLISAEAINESLDSVTDECGSTAWEDAGR